MLPEGTFGSFDILHNNAGVALERHLHETTDVEFDWLMGVNLRGVFLDAVLLSKPSRNQEKAE